MSLRACEASFICHCEARSNLSFISLQTQHPRDRHAALAMTVVVIARHKAISLFFLCQPSTTEIATFLAMTGLSLKQSLFCLFANLAQPRSPRTSRWQIEASLRSNPFCQSPLWGLRACRLLVIARHEAISLLSLCQPSTPEIATYLAMTGLSVKQSLFCMFANSAQPRSPRSSR